MRILVCDPQWAIRQSLSQILEHLDREIEAIEAVTVDNAAQRLKEIDDIKLVIIDPFSEGGDWLKQITRLHGKPRGPAVAIFTMNADRRDVLRALDCGAMAYIHKSASGDEIAKAISRVLDGEIYLPGSLLQQSAGGKTLMPTPHQSGSRAFSGSRGELSGRELEVLELLAQGMANAQIGATLHLSVNTVRVYISAILKKLGLSDRTQAALYGAKLLADRRKCN
ncbi:MAG: DNA-binding response regulator [Sphingomonadales bacterium]